MKESSGVEARTELLEWVESAAIENLKGHHQSAAQLAKESVQTLSVFVLIMAGSLALAARSIQDGRLDWFSAGAAGFAGWFFLLSICLVVRCMMRRKLPAIYNEPMHLYQPRYTLTALREVELENLQVRIVRARHSNARIARALDWLRFGAVASPIMFVVLSVVWWVGSSACGARP